MLRHAVCQSAQYGDRNQPRPFVISTLVGAATVFVTGVFIFSLSPFREFYAYSMNAGTATGVPRETPLLWAVLAGSLAYGSLITLAMARAPRPQGVAAGVRVGATVGFLLWCTANFMLYGISNVGNLASTLVDPFIELVPGAIAGGAIAAVLRNTDAVSPAQGVDGTSRAA
jgi:hypothetical protein